MSDLEIAREARVLTIRFTREAKRNALTVAMYAQLADALADAATSSEIDVVVTTGGPHVFTAGNDLADFADRPPVDDNAPVVRFITGLITFPKPLVAAVAGPAVGVGTTMLLHCDVVVAHTSARLQTPFVDLGLVPEAGSSWLLPRAVGSLRAARMLLLGEAIDAREAYAWGLVSTLVDDPDTLLPTAMSVARALAAKPQAAVRATKALLRGDAAALQAHARAEIAVFRERLASPEAQAAFARLLKRG